MNCILAFLFFGGVIAAATGEILQCVTCKVIQDGATNCEGELQQCDSDTDQCATQIEFNDMEGDIITTVKKGCFPAEYAAYCDRHFRLDSSGLKITEYTVCCNNADGCNSNSIQMPPENYTPNGRQCPTCFVEDGLECPSTEIKNCVGDQTDCINYSGAAARPGKETKDYAVQGCITHGACMLKFGGLAGTEIDSDNYQCTTA